MFFIYSLPRSRTAWLSVYLSYGKWRCFHRTGKDFTLHPDFAYTGFCELPKYPMLSNHKIVTIRRPLIEVYKSLEKFDPNLNEKLIEWSKTLDKIEENPNVLRMQFSELKTPEGCQKIFEHCLGEPFDRWWWMGLRYANVQIDPNR